jgi:hypothetical protein
MSHPRSALSVRIERAPRGVNWRDVLARLARRCPGVEQISFLSCDISSLSCLHSRELFPHLRKVHVLRCYHLRAPGLASDDQNDQRALTTTNHAESDTAAKQAAREGAAREASERACQPVRHASSHRVPKPGGCR